MKVYEGKVKDGKIRVDEPDGSRAVLVFDSQPLSVTVEKYKQVAVAKKGKRTVPVFRCKRKSRYSFWKLYDHVFGMPVGSFVKQQVDGGFNGTTEEMMDIIAKKFKDAGVGHMWKKRKLRRSVKCIIAQHGIKTAPVPMTPKSLSTKAIYKQMLGCSMRDYIAKQLKAGVEPYSLIEDICAKATAANVQLDRNKVGVDVFIKARRYSKGAKV